MFFWNSQPSVYLKCLLVVLIKWLYWLWERDVTPLIVWLLFILYNICIFIIRLFLGRVHCTMGEDTYQYKKTWKFTDYLYDNEKKTLLTLAIWFLYHWQSLTWPCIPTWNLEMDWIQNGQNHGLSFAQMNFVLALRLLDWSGSPTLEWCLL